MATVVVFVAATWIHCKTLFVVPVAFSDRECSGVLLCNKINRKENIESNPSVNGRFQVCSNVVYIE